MSRIVIVILIYHRHISIDLIYIKCNWNLLNFFQRKKYAIGQTAI
jgi:hypothetical protein